MDYVMIPSFYQNELMHYGTPRHSGRYPWGSGERPYQDEAGAGSEKERVKRIATGAVFVSGALATVGAAMIVKGVLDKDPSQYNALDQSVHDVIAATDMGKNIMDEMQRGQVDKHGNRKSFMDLDADYVIPKGTDIYNIGKNPNGPQHQSKWMSINKHDADFYKGIYTKVQNSRAGEDLPSYQTHYVAEKDIKGAGKKTAAKAFMEAYRGDKEFQKDFWDKVDFHSEWHPESFSKMREELKEADKNKNRSIKDRINYERKMRDYGYEFYNVGLTDWGEATSKITGTKYNFYYDSGKKVYDNLIKKGYGSILDVNDLKYSTFHTYAPQIMFNTDNELRKIDTRRLTNDEVNKAARDNAAVYGKRLIGHYAKSADNAKTFVKDKARNIKRKFK